MTNSPNTPTLRDIRRIAIIGSSRENKTMCKYWHATDSLAKVESIIGSGQIIPSDKLKDSKSLSEQAGFAYVAANEMDGIELLTIISGYEVWQLEFIVDDDSAIEVDPLTNDGSSDNTWLRSSKPIVIRDVVVHHIRDTRRLV